ncbi:cupin-like domain-containing protein [Gilvimarinus sp. DA14]|uniref:cupin-like domain-containing protein n=1 Tax=Gilvimarinus sp. DA14 TaxID=2956798 RepID=UPI0020B79462|nr:cupin-like domain-containing protein [Gilvimarinus sp. DA14]UTF61097.1 cupin-like domain-containing protein [Gilvimarinus sp. DA14]
MQTIREVNNINAETLRDLNEPVVMRQLVKQWPLVQAYRDGDRSFCEYLLRFDRGEPVTAVQGPASNHGRIFYSADMSGLNCRPARMQLASALDYILSHAGQDPAPTLAIQSSSVADQLPGLERENVMSLLSPEIAPRIWIGGRATVAAHYDGSENIACCVAGRRRFTLFAPDQVANLYPGPFEMTPAGAVISMVDFDNPDYQRYPNFRQAEENALVADLEPGDALYIPYLWWHHVRALDDLNVLINYWWGEPDPAYGDPRNALFYSMMALRTLPEAQREAWRSQFEYYVFERDGKPGRHLPAERRGIMESFSPTILPRLKQSLIRALSRR